MSKTVFVMGASISSKSINRQLATYAASFLRDVNYKVHDLSDYQCQMYSPQEQEKSEFPETITKLDAEIKMADGFIISFAENNYSYTAAYKNSIDWVTRLYVDKLDQLFEHKPCLFLSASPSNYGGAAVMENVLKFYPIFGAKIIGHMSLPRAHENLVDGKVVNKKYRDELEALVKQFEEAVKQT